MVYRAGPLWPAAGGQGRATSAAGASMLGGANLTWALVDYLSRTASANRGHGSAPDSGLRGQRLTNPQAGDPRTQIWVLLYAQVRQVDGKEWRNVLISRQRALPRVAPNEKGTLGPPASRDIVGVAEFEEAKVAAELADLALPENVGLSVIAVELLPGGPPQALVKSYAYGSSRWIPGSAGPAQQGGDPLGRELGSIASRRILRCSPLTPVAPAC